MRTRRGHAHDILFEPARLQRDRKLHQKGLGTAGVETADDMHHPRHTGPATSASWVNRAASS